MKVSVALIQELKRQHGTPALAGVSGANIESLFESALSEGLSPILTRHEFGAASLLDAYARLSGKPGILLCTSGAGALNAIPGIAESAASRVPLVAILGEPPLASQGRGAFQEMSGLSGSLDFLASLRPLCKSAVRISDPTQAIPSLRSALLQSTSGVPGPCVLLLPRDVQDSDITPPSHQEISTAPRSASRGLPLPVLPERNALFILGDRLARLPLSSRLLPWLEKHNQPFVLTLEARALAPLEHPLCRGVTGVMGDLRARAAVAESDRIYALGTRLSETDRYGIETMLLEKPLVLLNDEDSALRGPAWEFKPCDLEALLELLPDAPLLQENNVTPLDQLPGPLEREIELSDLAPLLAPLARSRARNWVLDAGNSTASVAGSLPIARGSTLTIALGMGGMGYSFGAGIGASLARPLPTVVVAGDGAFFMHGSEISTAVERNIPIHIILIDNHGHGMCATREELFFGRKESPLNRISRSRLAHGLAALYPTIPVRHAATCTDASEILKPSCGTQGPTITVIEISNREVPAFLPFQDLLQKRSLS